MKSYRNPEATWLGSPNYTPNRNGHEMSVQPAWVIIHTEVGTNASANARFQQAAQQASAHYGVGYDGSLVQWVDERDAAWAAGDLGINFDSINIEHEDESRYNDPRPDALYVRSASLVRGICQRYGIPIDRAHIRKHSEVSDLPTACPDALDIDRIIRQAQGAPAPTPAPYTPPPIPGVGVVVPTSPVAGVTWRPCNYVDWNTLAPQDACPVGTQVTWSAAKLVNGSWFNRIATPAGPVDWALADTEIDDGGFPPPHFAPTPPPPPPPPPPLPPVVVVPVPPVTPPVVDPPVVPPVVVPPVTPPAPAPVVTVDLPPAPPPGVLAWLRLTLDWLDRHFGNEVRP